MNAEAGVYRVRLLHRRKNVLGQIITQEKECTGTDHYTGEGMHRGRQFLRDECIGPNHYTGERI